jgi:hypothetical protein
MSHNSKELKVKYHGDKKGPSRKANSNVKDMSKMGYRRDSPYNTLPYMYITSPDGLISMDNVGAPLWVNGHILPPDSGTYQFDTTEVLEIPILKQGGHPSKAKAREMLHNPPHGKKLTDKQRKYFGWLANRQEGGEPNVNQLFQKYYGEVYPYDKDPDTGEDVTGYDYYFYGHPDFQHLDDSARGALIRRLSSFMEIDPNATTKASKLTTNFPFSFDNPRNM